MGRGLESTEMQDLKLENVMLDAGGEGKSSKFGPQVLANSFSLGMR